MRYLTDTTGDTWARRVVSVAFNTERSKPASASCRERDKPVIAISVSLADP